jgi:acylphosphatase
VTGPETGAREGEPRPTRRLLVAGRVQGVGFRYFTRAAALELGLAGWVRNLHDGRVEVLAQGTARSLDELAERLRQGPGRVERLEVSEQAAEPVPAGRGFEIRRSG